MEEAREETREEAREEARKETTEETTETVKEAAAATVDLARRDWARDAETRQLSQIDHCA